MYTSFTSPKGWPGGSNIRKLHGFTQNRRAPHENAPRLRRVGAPGGKTRVDKRQKVRQFGGEY